MNELVKLALLGVGGYFALRYFTNKSAAATVTETPGTPMTPVQATPSTAAVVAQQMQPAQGGPNPYQAALDPAYAATIGNLLMFTPDQWNWYRKQSTGIDTTTDLVDPANRDLQVTASAYHQLRAAKGLSGLMRRAWGM